MPWPLAGVVLVFLVCTLVGIFSSLDILLVDSLILFKKKNCLEGLHTFLRKVNDGLDCSAGFYYPSILAFSFLFYFKNGGIVIR